MKKFFSFFILYILVNLAADAQDEPLIGNYMIARNLGNQSFVGAEKTINAVFLNRTSFVGIEGRPMTSVFGIEAPVDLFGTKSGVGILIMNDEYGNYSNVNVDASYAYHHQFSTGTIGGGINIGFKSYRLTADWGDDVNDPDNDSRFTPYSSDPLIPTNGDVEVPLFRIGAGAYYENPEYYVGLSVANINQPVVSYFGGDEIEYEFDYLAMTFFLTGGYNIEMPDPLFDLQPTFMLRTDLAVVQLDVNSTMYFKDKYWAGLGLRVSPRSIDAISIMGGLELVSGLNLGYMMDINTNGLFLGGATSHEVLVTYSFNIDTKRDQKYKSVRYL